MGKKISYLNTGLSLLKANSNISGILLFHYANDRSLHVHFAILLTNMYWSQFGRFFFFLCVYCVKTMYLDCTLRNESSYLSSVPIRGTSIVNEI